MGRKTTAEMVGEAMRELGVLLALFAPLERIVVKGERLSPAFVVTVAAWVLGLVGLGILIERTRKLEE
jgi:hypothetical protein